MVDSGEAVSTTVRREFEEEAGALTEAEQAKRFRGMADTLFGSGGEVVYRGYVDDPRNTDNAWMESTVFHFHCRPQLGRMLPLHAGDDAKAVMWLTVNESEPRYKRLYASHKDWVDSVHKRLHNDLASPRDTTRRTG